MNTTVKAIIGVVLVLVITFTAISICQNLGKSMKIDITEQKLYTLSPGTGAILARLNQPIKAKLYYAETAALKGPDQIRYFNNYYQFVKALLEEYVSEAHGMIELQLIDPRPFSDDEIQALRYGLRKFTITEEESFFFGLVIQTQFGIEKVIPFFSPDRQNFVEYDISYLIDTALTRQKTRVGILSSLPVMGDDVTGYMAQMMKMQGQQPKPAWTFVEQLKQQYEVQSIPADTNQITDVDMLLVVHPKNLPEKTLFAIDQFVLKGGRTVICIDPYCFADQPSPRAMQMGQPPTRNSNLKTLLKTWGLEMPENTFAGDRSLAIKASMTQNQRPETIIGFLNLNPQANCFNTDTVITADLNQVRMLFSGVLRQIADEQQAGQTGNIQLTPLLMTTNRGNSWSVNSPYELSMPSAAGLLEKFIDGTKPVSMACLVTGKFKSAFPDGIEIETDPDQTGSDDPRQDPNDQGPTKKHLTGLTQAQHDCAVIVFADVDFISDLVAYQRSFFGNLVVGDNSALLLNAIDDLSGSGDLISIRSRGNYRRPFVVVDQIEQQAEAETAEEEAKINAEIEGFRNELQNLLASAKEGQEEIIGSSILQKKKIVELKIHQAQRQLNDVKLQKRQRIEHLGNMLRSFNMLTAPAVILIIAIILSVRRNVRKRHYISHASDA